MNRMTSYGAHAKRINLSSRYQRFNLRRNPFPAIPILCPSCSDQSPIYYCDRIFEKEARITEEILSRENLYKKPLIIFVEGSQGSGKSHFLEDLTANCRNPGIFPVFCQIYTGGGFSDITDRALQWLGLGGYAHLILSFLDSLGMSESDIFQKSPYTIFHELVPMFQETFGIENQRVLERILKSFLSLDVGYCNLFRTSAKYKNLILVALVYLVRKALNKKTLLVIDNLENRWPYFTCLNKEHFYNNLEQFIRLTQDDIVIMFSDNGKVRKDITRTLKESNVEFSPELVELSALTLTKSMVLISGYLKNSRLDEECKTLGPFDEKAIGQIFSMSNQNIRIFLELCHDVIEESLEFKTPEIGLADVKRMLY